MKNPARRKNREAEYFLSVMKQTFEDDNAFSCNLSAFLSAARSMTFYMQKQYSHRNGFAEWYCRKQIEMSADRELVFLKKARVEDIHTETVRTGATREATGDARACIAVEGTLENEQVGETKPKPPTQSSPKTLRRFFPELENGDVVEFCERQLAKLSKLVEECESRFP